MRIYISGPITGRNPFEVLDDFGAVSIAIAEAGHISIDPANMVPWGLTWDTYMKIATTILESGEVDAMVMLRGWEMSRGAVLEWIWAKKHGIRIGYQSAEDERIFGGIA